jgi:hypothetical protein
VIRVEDVKVAEGDVDVHPKTSKVKAESLAK